MEYPEVIVFDLDDTIVSFGSGAEPAWREVCGEFCVRNPWCCAGDLFKAIRTKASWYWSDPERHRLGRADLHAARREIVTLAWRELGYEDRGEAVAIADDFSERRMKNVSLFPGAIATLDALAARGQRMVLLTNGESRLQRDKINRFGLGKYFELICIEGEVGYGKPDPRAYFNILTITHLSPSNLWMVGDNLDWDVRSPQELGIYSIWNDYRHQGLPPGSTVVPDRIIHSIRELIAETLFEDSSG
ncbi:MAG: HAD family hydrolase [Spirochaetales bacterium]|nr:HAD family hydrolase [Spirochaetales bacterium]